MEGDEYLNCKLTILSLKEPLNEQANVTNTGTGLFLEIR